MATIKQAYAASVSFALDLHATQMITAAARESDYVSNVTDAYIDVIGQLKIKLSTTGAPASDKQVNVYAYGGETTSTGAWSFTDNATGTNAQVTLRSPTNFRLVQTIQTPDASDVAYRSPPFSIAAAFGGVMPRHWGVVVENRTNIQFASSSGLHAATYTGILSTSA